jgi:hypothetical protein
MLRTRVAIIFATLFAVLFGGLSAGPANAAPLCDSSCVLQQLQAGNFVPVPSGPGVRTVAADGSMLYYTNPRGELEIRLSHDKTTSVIENSWYVAVAATSAVSLYTGAGEAVAAMKIFPVWVPKAAGTAGILGTAVANMKHLDYTNIAVKAMQRDLCLGATVYPNSVRDVLTRPARTYISMLQGNLGGAAAAMAGIKSVWFEPCSLNKGQLSDAMKSSTLRDIGQAPKPVGAAPAQATPAQPIGKAYAATVMGTCNEGHCGLSVRVAPGYTNVGRVDALPDGTRYTIVCQIRGETVNGRNGSSNVWNGFIYGGVRRYVSDYYSNTPGINQLIAGLPGC